MIKKPLILGHRGYNLKFPENTLLAFDKAYEYGADGIECDVQKCLDGTFVIFHDYDLERITGRAGFIDELSFDNIKKLNAGMNQTIPDIDSFLDSIPEGKLINIELKDEVILPADCFDIIEKLTKRALKQNILISSFRHDLLIPFKENGFSTGMLFNLDTLKLGIFKIILNIKKNDPDYLNFPVDFFVCLPVFIKKLLIFLLKKSRRKIVLWTVNEESEFRMVSEFADVIITDMVEKMILLRDNV